MKYTTLYSLNLSLLILLIACQQSLPEKIEAEPEAFFEAISPEELITMKAQADKPYVLVNFFTTYCKPCIKEMPELIASSHDSSSSLEVIFVSIDEPETVKQSAILTAFSDKVGVMFDSYYMDPDQFDVFIKTEKSNWNRSIPLNMLYSKDGRLIESMGMTDREELEMIIRRDQRFHQ